MLQGIPNPSFSEEYEQCGDERLVSAEEDDDDEEGEEDKEDEIEYNEE